MCYQIWKIICHFTGEDIQESLHLIIPVSNIITICTYEKKCLFGTVDELNEFGKIAYRHMIELASHYQFVRVDNFIIMPNHIHAIISIEQEGTVNLSTVIGWYKAGVSREIGKRSSEKIWQRSYHEHIIRNQHSYEKIWNYVQFNS